MVFFVLKLFFICAIIATGKIQGRHLALPTERMDAMSNTAHNDFVARMRLGMDQMTIGEAFEILISRAEVLEERGMSIKHLLFGATSHEQFIELLVLPTEDDTGAILEEFIIAFYVSMFGIGEVQKMVEILESRGLPTPKE